MFTMQLQMNLDAQRFVQQIQMHNETIESEVEKGLNKAFEELGREGVIEQMIVEAAKKSIMDSFSRWVFQCEIKKSIETQIAKKLNGKIEAYTDKLVSELAEKMNLPDSI